MLNIGDFLDRARAGLAKQMNVEAVTDYRLAKHIGYQQTTLSGWRAERSMPDERAIVQLCLLTGDDPVDIAVRIQSMRAANDDAADLWRRVADRLKGGAAVVACLVVAYTSLAYVTDGATVAGAHAESLLVMSSHAGAAVGIVLALRLAWRIARRRRSTNCPEPAPHADTARP